VRRRHEIAGPYVELLQWRMFGSYGCCMQYRGLPWWNLAGFFVQDHTEQRVAYVQACRRTEAPARAAPRSG
jgi:hypothetical protein